MKKMLCLLIFFSAILWQSNGLAQSSASTLDVVSWNIEWFGATFEAPTNDDLQRENAKKIIRYLDADIYGLTEIVDTAQVRRLVDSLGTDYGYVISSFCSGANAPGGNAWRNGQKLLFLYKKSVITNVTTRGMLRASTGDAYTNWASGRFPFLLNANATIDGVTKNLNLILIHGKAGSTSQDYDRRKAGAQELKDSLDVQFPNSINIIFGDFNDALNQTISTGSGPASSYQPIVADSTDADHYKSITLPLAYAGQTTMINFPNVIDNHVISNEMVPFYVLNSAKIRTDITAVVPDFVTAHNTSDHYPVFSKYSLSGMITAVPSVTAVEFGVLAYPNPFIDKINLSISKTIHDVSVSVLNMEGQLIQSQHFDRLTQGSTVELRLPSLPKGIYFLQFQTPKLKTVIKLIQL